MSSEEESIEMELSILQKEQKSYLMQEKIYSFRKSDEFKPKFKSLKPIVCSDCGKHYRVTHWCELMSNIVYVDDWQNRLLTHFQTMIEVEKKIESQKSLQQFTPSVNNTKGVQVAKPKKDTGRNFCCACFGIIALVLVIFVIPRLF